MCYADIAANVIQYGITCGRGIGTKTQGRGSGQGIPNPKGLQKRTGACGSPIRVAD